MKLNATNIKYISHRMDNFRIMYQEIYDELTDHVITAIETARANNDSRTIEIIFDDVIDSHFGGGQGIKKIALKNALAYHKKTGKALWADIKYYLNHPVILAMIVLIFVSFYLPHNKITSIVLMALLIIAAGIPYVYVYRRSKKTVTGYKKLSLVKDWVRVRSVFLVPIVSLLFCSSTFGKLFHIYFLNPLNFYPVVYMLFISFFLIYGLSCIRLCNQEFKVFSNIK
jgi:hypothetical protein